MNGERQWKFTIENCNTHSWIEDDSREENAKLGEEIYSVFNLLTRQEFFVPKIAIFSQS